MIGIIWIVSFVAVCVGLMTYSKDDRLVHSKEYYNKKLSQDQFGVTLTAIFSFVGFLLNVLVLIDKSLFKAVEVSPIFGVDYFQVWTMTMILVWITVILAGGLFLVSIIELWNINYELKKNHINTLSELKYIEQKAKETEQRNLEEEKSVESRFGSYDKMIAIDAVSATGYKGYKNALYVSMSTRKIMVYERIIDFDDIISCTYTDNGHVESIQSGNSTSTTKTDNGNVIGRALVGGLIGGEAGAIIGGATAKKNTTTVINTTTTSRTVHDYTVILNIKDVINPICKIPCQQSERRVNEIVGTVNAIIQSR